MTTKQAELGYPGRVDLYWLPLGAGANAVVRWSGRLYEAIAARHDHRLACDLYHSALEVHVGDDRFVIEMAPVWVNARSDRGVVGEGAVWSPWLRHSRLFRYEVRRWRDGTLADIAEAVASPQRVGSSGGQAQRLLDLVPVFPTATWGRDELDTGDMWNSNSLIAWLLARSGHHIDLVDIPSGGRAPGWSAGLVAACGGVDSGDLPVPTSTRRLAAVVPRGGQPELLLDRSGKAR